MKGTYKQPQTIKVNGKGKKLSKKVMGKEVGDGEFYADPYRGGDPEAFYGYNGYPNDIPSTQTVKTRGTGAATKGTHSSKKLA